FVAPKVKGAPVITDEVVRTAASDPDRVPADVRAAIEDLAADYRFLHLHVAFPDVFTVPEDVADAENELCGWSGGFDVVLGNPPGDQVELKDKEFFAVRDPGIAALPGSRRKRAIQELANSDPQLYGEFTAAARDFEGRRSLLTDSDRFPLCGRGRVNT